MVIKGINMYSLRKTVRVDALKDAERESATYGEIGYKYG